METAYAAVFEQLLQLHGLDFWHCQVPQRSQPGFPDYNIFGTNWIAYVELKARNPLTNRAGKVSPAQNRYKAAIEKAGGEWKSFLFPDDWPDIDAWLNGHTGKEIWGQATRAWVVP